MRMLEIVEGILEDTFRDEDFFEGMIRGFPFIEGK